MDESEEKKGEVKEGTKEEENKEEKAESPDIVLGVHMHCQACAKKVEKSLRKIPGVEEVKADTKAQRVVLKGNMADLDPIKTCETVEKKTGRKTVLVSPSPDKPAEEQQEKEKEKEEKEEAPKQAGDDNKQEPDPTPITVVLKMRMHCEACAHVLQKRIMKVEGVDTVETDLLNDQVMIKGLVDPEKLVDHVYRRTRKHVSIIKEVETKEEEVRGEDAVATAADDDTKRYHEYWPPKYNSENVYGPQIFSDEDPNSCSLM